MNGQKAVSRKAVYCGIVPFRQKVVNLTIDCVCPNPYCLRDDMDTTCIDCELWVYYFNLFKKNLVIVNV